MVKYKGREIVYSFRYGGACPRKFLMFLYFIFGIVWIALLCGLIAMLVRDGEMNADNITVMCLMIGFFGLGAFFLVLDIHYRRIEDKYALWLTDEYLVEEKVVPFEYSMRTYGDRKTHRFGVAISMDGEKIVKYNKNYDGFFALHSEEMDVLYAPTYDEIMVLGIPKKN